MTTSAVAMAPAVVTPVGATGAGTTGSPAGGSGDGTPFAALVEEALLAQLPGEGEEGAASLSAGQPGTDAASLPIDIMAMQAALLRGGEVLFSAAGATQTSGAAGSAPLVPALVAAVLPSSAAVPAGATADAPVGAPTGAEVIASAPSATPAAATASAVVVAATVAPVALAGRLNSTSASGSAQTPVAAGASSVEDSSGVPVAGTTPVAAVGPASPPPVVAPTSVGPVGPQSGQQQTEQFAAVAAATDTAPDTSAPASSYNAGVAAPAGPAGPAAAAAPAAPPAPVPTPAAQLLPHIAPLRQAADGTHSLVVRLSPEELGPVQVRVEVRQGVLSLELVGASEMAREALRGGLAELRRDLGSAGITTGSFDVRGETSSSGGRNPDLGRSDGGSGGSGSGGNRSGTPGGSAGGDDAATPTAPLRAPTASGDRALDLSL